MSMSREDLALIASDFYGPRWRHALARALGPYHPRGPRETIDPRLVARWASGDRPIPEWVKPALGIIARQHLAGMERYLRRAGLLKD